MQRKRILAGSIVAAVMCMTLAVPAFADANQYLSNPGYAVSTAQTACAGHGAFQYFEGQPGIIPHVYIAQDRTQGTTLGAETGAANSNLCGNPQ